MRQRTTTLDTVALSPARGDLARWARAMPRQVTRSWYLHLEQPEVVADRVLEFLREAA